MQTGNSYLIQYDDEIEAVYLEWLHPPDLQAFKSAHFDGLYLLQEYKLCRWLENRQRLHDLSSDCHIWARDEWFPRAAKSGIRYLAIVLSQLPLSPVSIEQISEMLEMDVITDYFDEMVDARKWLHHPYCE
ncbi:MAG: hypothetical protein JXB03_01490 [Spirochaetales bacterium]|nr:hypothetical protein [Spirochaetales bacterium]